MPCNGPPHVRSKRQRREDRPRDNDVASSHDSLAPARPVAAPGHPPEPRTTVWATLGKGESGRRRRGGHRLAQSTHPLQGWAGVANVVDAGCCVLAPSRPPRRLPALPRRPVGLPGAPAAAASVCRPRNQRKTRALCCHDAARLAASVRRRLAPPGAEFSILWGGLMDRLARYRLTICIFCRR